MKRFILITISIIMILSSFVAPTMAAPGDLTFTVGTTTGNPGNDVLIPITITNNFNALDVVAVTVTFDSTRLEWQNLGTYVPGNTATHPWTHGGFIPFLSNPGTLGTNSVTFYFMDQNGVYVESGTLVTLRLRVKDAAPSGDAAVTLSFNSVGDSRGSLNNTQYNNEAGKVTVTPQSNLTLSAGSWNPTAAGGSTSISVTSNVSWTASSNATSWLTVSPASGSNNGSLTLTAQANSGTSSRTGTITVTGGGLTPQTVTVIQAGSIPSTGSTLIVSPAQGKAGDEVTVNISIADNPGFANFALRIEYDNAKLEYLSFTEGLTNGMLANSVPVSGSTWAVTLTWAYYVNMAQDGVLFSLTFRIRPDMEDGVVPLTLTYQEGMIKNQYGVNINPDVSNGAVTILNVMIGDVDSDGMITPYDATLVLQHIVGIITLEGKALIAADVDRDGVITPYDATLILQYIVGIITEFPQ